jgi:Arc/MetJ-type ribon-helix-helix transcriptional regulator
MKIMIKDKTKNEDINIPIPKSIYKKIEERIKQTDFDSVASYVKYILEEVLSEEEDDETVFSEEDEKRVKDRLKALGYLD